MIVKKRIVLVIVVENLTYNIPKKAQDRWPWVLYQFRLRGFRLQDVARELNVHTAAVYKVASLKSDRVQRAIARRLGLRPEDLWPERYTQFTTPAARRNGKSRGSRSQEAA